jgi:transposase InsO family protein
VRRQGYYEYRERKDSVRKVRDRVLKTKIENIFYESDRIYGARKIRAQLRKGGDDVSRKHVRRLMDEAGLVPVTWRKRVQTTVSDPQAKPFCNLLKQDFRVALPNLTWVSDFTYVPTDEGWLYVCSFVDLFSRRVVGWETSDTIDRNLTIAAFRRAVENRHPGKHLVIHTDRGCQYTSWDFRREVAATGGIQSMSRPGHSLRQCLRGDVLQDSQDGMRRKTSFQDPEGSPGHHSEIHPVLQQGSYPSVPGLSHSGRI